MSATRGLAHPLGCRQQQRGRQAATGHRCRPHPAASMHRGWPAGLHGGGGGTEHGAGLGTCSRPTPSAQRSAMRPWNTIHEGDWGAVNGLGLWPKHHPSHKTLFDGEKTPPGATLPFCHHLARLIF